MIIEKSIHTFDNIKKARETAKSEHKIKAIDNNLMNSYDERFLNLANEYDIESLKSFIIIKHFFREFEFIEGSVQLHR
jgi:hypothetical protein